MPSAMKLRFDSTMPLGVPVVPPEKRMAAEVVGPVPDSAHGLGMRAAP